MQKADKDFRASDQEICVVKVTVDPGICGFSREVQAYREGPRSVRVEILLYNLSHAFILSE